MTWWNKLRQQSPEAAIKAARSRVGSDWPYFLLDDAGGPPPSDNLRSELARTLVQEPTFPEHWPAALLLLLPPYPTDATTWLNLLGLVEKLLQHDDGPAPKNFIARVATVALSTAFDVNDLVAFEAASVLGGIEDSTLVFKDENERTAIHQRLSALIATVRDAEVATELSERARPSVDTARLDVVTAADASGVEAAFRSLVFQPVAGRHEALRSPLAHMAARLRAFAEGQRSTRRLRRRRP